MTKNVEVINNSHLPAVIRIDLFTGVTMDVSPVSQVTLIQLQEAAKKRYPDPDTTPFLKPLPGAAVEGDTYLDSDDPGYKKLIRELAFDRNVWIKKVVYLMACQPAAPVTKEDLIARFAPVLDNLREYIELPEDDWEATLLHALLVKDSDIELIENVAYRNAALTFDEVADGLRIFRPKVQSQNGAGMAGTRTPEHGDGEADNIKSG